MTWYGCRWNSCLVKPIHIRDGIKDISREIDSNCDNDDELYTWNGLICCDWFVTNVDDKTSSDIGSRLINKRVFEKNTMN